MVEISFQRQWEYDKDVHYLRYYFNIFLEKIKQKALIPVNSSENDCFADDVVEEAEETCTLVSPVSIGG